MKRIICCIICTLSFVMFSCHDNQNYSATYIHDGESYWVYRYYDDKYGDELYGFKDENGNVVIEAEYKFALPFREGLAMVAKKDGLIRYDGVYDVSYIDIYGNDVIELDENYTELCDSFSEGYAAVRLSEFGWGYIDKSGNIVIDHQYQMALKFKNGVATVLLNGVWMQINKNGEVVSFLDAPVNFYSDLYGDMTDEQAAKTFESIKKR